MRSLLDEQEISRVVLSLGGALDTKGGSAHVDILTGAGVFGVTGQCLKGQWHARRDEIGAGPVRNRERYDRGQQL